MIRKLSIVIGGLGFLVGCLAASSQSFAAGLPIPMVFSAIGSAPPSVSCNNTSNGCNDTNCSCLAISGKGKGTNLGKSTFTSQTVVEHQTVGESLCDPAEGTMTITTANSKNVLVVGFSGWDCFTGSGLIGFNGPYTVDGANSTGKFANATGGGTMSVNEDAASSGNFFGTLNGNVILAK